MNSGSDEPEQVDSVSYFEENNKKKKQQNHMSNGLRTFLSKQQSIRDSKSVFIFTLCMLQFFTCHKSTV